MSMVVVATLGTTFLTGAEGAAASTATPSQVLAAAGAAAKGQRSFHYVATDRQSGQSVTIAGDVSKTEGTQKIVANIGGQTGHVTVILVGGSAYFRGDAAGLHGFMQLSAPLASGYANQWISVTMGEPGYAEIAAGLTTASALSQVEIAKPITLRGQTKKMGQQVLIVGGTESGMPNGSAKQVTIPVRLYVNASGPPLPVLFSATWVVGHSSQVQTVSFSHWREPVHVTVPASPVPVGSLGGSPVEA
jgi:hypothetical protein